jgi:hypothetical protein
MTSVVIPTAATAVLFLDCTYTYKFTASFTGCNKPSAALIPHLCLNYLSFPHVAETEKGKPNTTKNGSGRGRTRIQIDCSRHYIIF